MTRLNLAGAGLDSLPPPQIVDEPEFQEIRQAIVDSYLANNEEATEVLDSDPVGKLIDTVAYHALLLRQRVNDGVKAVLTGTASETELSYLAARFGIARDIVKPGDPFAVPPVPDELEPLERFRERIQLALDGYSTAGPEGAYRFHALNASPLVKDVSVDAPEFDYAQLAPELAAQLPPNVIVLACTHDAGLANPMPGDIAITLLSAEGDGATSPELGNAVLKELGDNVPLSDRPRLRAEQILNYAVEAVLKIPPGPDAETIRQAAQKAVEDYVQKQHGLGKHVRLSALYHACHQSGVDDVELISPPADVMTQDNQAAFCTGINVTAEVLQ